LTETRRSTGLTLLLVGAIITVVGMVLQTIFQFWDGWGWGYYSPLYIIFGFLMPLAAGIITLIGFAMFRSEYVAPFAQAAPRISTVARICTKCGHQITITDSEFCPFCGKKLER